MQNVKSNVAWRAIPIAGFVAGTAFLLVNAIFNPILYGIDPLFIINYFGSLVLGTDVLLETTIPTVIVGLAVHFALSILFTLIISIAIHRWGLIVGIVGGGLLGLAIYSINFYTMTIFFEWMFALNNTLLVISHIVFGAVAGGVYELFDDYDEDFVVEAQTA